MLIIWYMVLLAWTTASRFSSVAAISIRRNVTSNMSLLSFHQVESCESTQDEAKKLLLLQENDKPFLAVSANQQVKGRGTSGRVWKGSSGNVFLTIAFSMNKVPVKVTLLPLQVGILIHSTLQQVLTNICNAPSSTKLTLKWPNDVLLQHKKVAGVLIESTIVNGETYFLVGIGINIQQAPTIQAQEGRQATCLAEYCRELPDRTSQVIAADVANKMVEWMTTTTTTTNDNIDADGNEIVNTWRGLTEFGTPQTLRETGEVVTPMSIQDDGQLLVRQENGQERLLMAEYLY